MKLVVFDIDGTLVKARDEHDADHKDSVWVLLHKYFGVFAEAGEQYKLFHDGKLSYEEWVAANVELWKDAGATEDKIQQAFVECTEKVLGADEVLAELKARGYIVAALSGGLLNLIDFHFHGVFKQAYANELLFEAGSISGCRATPYDFAQKADGLKRIASDFGFSMKDVVFVGDHVNDEEALRAAGVGVAINPISDSVRESADKVLSELPEVLTIL